MIRNKNLPEGATGSPATIDPYIRLMAGVLIQAAIDAKRGDCVDKVDALTWLASPEAEAMAEILGLQVDLFASVINRTFKLPYDAVRGAENKFGWRMVTNRPRKVRLIKT